ncbi:hypothetical protein Nepgr_009421 [Nepenthes gracilis]|uniref:H(+)-exporting diphosphatase n=1 Tax=Nepenthes gracilis TaxID=150966 RepID=A0AAD3SB98_NEPGR|nr:hypothetical protein Nepgr_009421 [Nepenthes gracilis]
MRNSWEQAFLCEKFSKCALQTMSVLELLYEMTEVKHAVEFLSNTSMEPILRSRAMILCGRVLSKENIFMFISTIEGRLVPFETRDATECESALHQIGSPLQGATLLLPSTPDAPRCLVGAAFGRQSLGEQRLGKQTAALHALGNIAGENRSQNAILNGDAEENLYRLIYEVATQSSKLTLSDAIIALRLLEKTKITIAKPSKEKQEAVEFFPYIAKRFIANSSATKHFKQTGIEVLRHPSLFDFEKANESAKSAEKLKEIMKAAETLTDDHQFFLIVQLCYAKLLLVNTSRRGFISFGRHRPQAQPYYIGEGNGGKSDLTPGAIGSQIGVALPFQNDNEGQLGDRDVFICHSLFIDVANFTTTPFPFTAYPYAGMGFLLVENGHLVLNIVHNLFKLYHDGDVDANFVGEVKGNSPKDCSRHSVVLANKFGDTIGDMVGMESDLFGPIIAFIESVVSLMSLELDWKASLCEEPVMLLNFVLLECSLETIAKIKASNAICVEAFGLLWPGKTLPVNGKGLTGSGVVAKSCLPVLTLP